MPVVALSLVGDRGLTAEAIARDRGHNDVASMLAFALECASGVASAASRLGMEWPRSRRAARARSLRSTSGVVLPRASQINKGERLVPGLQSYRCAVSRSWAAVVVFGPRSHKRQFGVRVRRRMDVACTSSYARAKRR